MDLSLEKAGEAADDSMEAIAGFVMYCGPPFRLAFDNGTHI